MQDQDFKLGPPLSFIDVLVKVFRSSDMLESRTGLAQPETGPQSRTGRAQPAETVPHRAAVLRAVPCRAAPRRAAPLPGCLPAYVSRPAVLTIWPGAAARARQR